MVLEEPGVLLCGFPFGEISAMRADVATIEQSAKHESAETKEIFQRDGARTRTLSTASTTQGFLV